MRILSITAGAAGMYCGSCSRDNALAVELLARGHEVTLLPLYTPTNPDETNVSRDRVLFGGISIYLQQYARAVPEDAAIPRSTLGLRPASSTPSPAAPSRRTRSCSATSRSRCSKGIAVCCGRNSTSCSTGSRDEPVPDVDQPAELAADRAGRGRCARRSAVRSAARCRARTCSSTASSSHIVSRAHRSDPSRRCQTSTASCRQPILRARDGEACCRSRRSGWPSCRSAST